MIFVRINLDSEGCLREIDARGHSYNTLEGKNVLCGAFTVMVKNVAKVIYSDTEIQSDGNAESPGNLWFKVKTVPESKKEWLKGITDILIAGLFDLESQFKGEINVILEEELNGT